MIPTHFITFCCSSAFNDAIGYLSGFLIKMQEGEYDCKPSGKTKVLGERGLEKICNLCQICQICQICHDSIHIMHALKKCIAFRAHFERYLVLTQLRFFVVSRLSRLMSPERRHYVMS